MTEGLQRAGRQLRGAASTDSTKAHLNTEKKSVVKLDRDLQSTWCTTSDFCPGHKHHLFLVGKSDHSKTASHRAVSQEEVASFPRHKELWLCAVIDQM